MDVPSYQFLGFAVAIALLINISENATWRRSVFLIANLAFVATFTVNIALLAPFAALLALGYGGMRWIETRKRKVEFIAIVSVVVIVFCWLKRYTFLPHTLFLPYAYFTIGMSYVLFRVLSLVIDAYEGSLPNRVGVVSYLNYTLNFTSLVSGPIQLYQDYYESESAHPPTLSMPVITRAVERIILGFLKVSIVSPLLSLAQQRSLGAAFVQPGFLDDVGFAALAVGIFPVYLYVNFSGYMDFVVGIARFLRLELPENFNNPFVSEGFIEFWSRWHITLSNWLKTYVYSPLLIALMRRFSSSRVEPFLGVFTYFVTFFLVGLWHGRTAMFIFYGVLLGLGVSVNKIYQIGMTRRLGRAGYRALCRNGTYSALSRGLTFWWFAVSLMWFWSTPEQLSSIAVLLSPVGSVAALALILVGSSAVLTVCSLGIEAVRKLPQYDAITSSPLVRTACFTALAGAVVSVAIVLDAPAPHIIYKAF